MAGKTVGKFLSPAHFEVIPNRVASTSKPVGVDKKLLTPREYEKINFTDKRSKELDIVKKNSEADFEKYARREVDCLRDEVKALKKLLEKKDIEQGEEFRNSRDHFLRRAKTSDVNYDPRRIAELGEENAVLQSETKKQQVIISKLRNDVKEIKLNYEREIEKLDSELTKYDPLNRQLKQELKEKDAKYGSDVEELQKQLKNQACEMKDLKSELCKAHEQIKIDREGFENILSEHESQKYLDIKNLRESLNNCKVKYSRDVKDLSECIVDKENVIAMLQTDLKKKDEQISGIKDQAERKEKEFLDKISQHKADIQSSQECFEETGQELRHALQEAVKSHEKALEDFREKLHKKDQAIKQEQNTIEQLRVYIGENLPDAQLERLKIENKKVQGQMEVLKKENETGNSTIEFLKIRLKSLNEIITIQENELNKTMASSVHQADNLLTKWRQKVFALLVQLNSQEISLENDKNTHRHLVTSLQCDLEASRKDLDIISHTLTDRNAELQIECNTTKALQLEIAEKKASEENLNSSLKGYQAALLNLHEYSSSMAPFLENLCANMKEAFVKLGSLSQRVSFAAGRVQFLQGLFAHKEAQWKNELKNALEDQETKSDTQKIVNEEERCTSSELLLNEIKKVTKERDILAAKTAKDAELLFVRVANIKAECDAQLEESSSKIEKLKYELKEERERCKSISNKLEALKSNLQEANETIDNLKIDLAKHQAEAERTLDKMLGEKQAQFTEECAQLEKQLNDVRREHTKTIVVLRQAEHQVLREREKLGEQLTLQQKEYDMKLEQLEKKIKILDKERNMLMMTVRQEGLLVPQKQSKGYSPSAGSESDEKENKTLSASGTSEVKQSSRHKHKKGGKTSRRKGDLKPENNSEIEFDPKDMTSALCELKSLSEALLNMKDDDDDG